MNQLSVLLAKLILETKNLRDREIRLAIEKVEHLEEIAKKVKNHVVKKTN